MRGRTMRSPHCRWLLLTLVMAVIGAPVFAWSPAIAQETSVTTRSVITVAFASAPAAPAFIAVTRSIVPPGTSITSGATVGPRLILIESGQIAIRSGARNEGFRRAADAPPSFSAGGAGQGFDRVLGPGEHLLPDTTEPFDLVNEGTRAAIFLDAFIASQAPAGVVPYTSMDGVVVDPLVGGIADALPASPLQLVIEQVEITPGASVDLPDVDGPRLLVVESGTLELSAASGVITYSGAAGLNPGSVAGRARTLAIGKRALLRARSSVFIQASATGIARNSGRNELTLFKLSLQSAP